MCTILAVGRDYELQVTRSHVLRQTKADVITASADEAVGILKAKPIDLVVLCHTLSQREMMEIASVAHQWAPTRVLHLTSRRMEGSPPELAADAVIVAEPQLLVAKVTQLLKK